MSDHHDDPGGHELEAVNTKLLFQLVGSLSIVTLLAAMAVVQWFHSQQRELQDQYAAAGSFILEDYKAKMSKDIEGLDASAQGVLADVTKMKAAPVYPGWVNPDPAAASAAAAPAAPGDAHGAHDGHDHGAKPAEPAGAKPAEPAGDKPAEPAGDKPAEPAGGAKPAEPAGDKPAEPAGDKPAEPAGDKPAGDKPAEPAGDKPE